jgi:hypothetical protein
MGTRTLGSGVFVLAIGSVANAQTSFGPTPYSTAADSPFTSLSFQGYFFLEDMEDHLFNVPGVAASTGGPFGPGPTTDLVDAADGSVDGSGTMGISYFVAGSGNPVGNFTFDAAVLGRLPTHVGIVLTDAYNPAFAEAFDVDDQSLGVVTVTSFGPPPDTQGQTSEDRFVGFYSPLGIRSLRVNTSEGGGLEVDHFQYGLLEPLLAPYCSGDGTGTACPCGNNGAAGNGCGNPVNPTGAHLGGTGNPSVSNDTVVLNGTGMPSSSVLYFAGTAQVNGRLGTLFGDGLRCSGGAVSRLVTMANTNGSSSCPRPGDPPLSLQAGVAPGSTRRYQSWYRNTPTFCTGSGFNLTNGLEIPSGP